MNSGRDEKWRKETIANTSEQQFQTEFECEFLGSIDTLITPSKLRTLAYKTPETSNADSMFMNNHKKITHTL